MSASLQGVAKVLDALKLRRSRRLQLAPAVALVLLFLVAPATSALAHGRRHDHGRPTIVLVHGAWAGPDGWDDVVQRLHRDGYRTVTPTLDMTSLAGDVATVRATLDSIPGDKILVAHSYGGFVASNASAGRSDVLALVFTAAFVPDEGDSILSLGVGYQPSGAFNHLIPAGTSDPAALLIDPNYFPQYFAQDLNPKLAARLNAEQRPIDAGILSTPSGSVGWHDIPMWYAVSGSDLIIDPAEERAMAQRAGATIVTFPAASHAGGYTHYAARFTDLIEQAVRETAG